MSDLEGRITARARQLWEQAGSPPSRTAADYRDQAAELVAIEDNKHVGRLPNPLADESERPFGEPAEPTLAVRNQGEFPTLTDEGEGVAYPGFDNEKER